MALKKRNYLSVESKIETIKEHKEDLAEHIYDIVAEQVDMWRKVPYLALSAYGRIDEENDHLIACKYGIWPLSVYPSRPGFIHAGVELSSGHLINPVNLEMLDTHVIINLEEDEYNANLIVSGLKKASKAPRDYDVCSSRSELATLHRNMRKEFNVDPMYYRDERNPLTAIGRLAVEDAHDDISELINAEQIA